MQTNNCNSQPSVCMSYSSGHYHFRAVYLFKLRRFLDIFSGTLFLFRSLCEYPMHHKSHQTVDFTKCSSTILHTPLNCAFWKITNPATSSRGGNIAGWKTKIRNNTGSGFHTRSTDNGYTKHQTESTRWCASYTILCAAFHFRNCLNRVEAGLGSKNRSVRSKVWFATCGNQVIRVPV